jgi:Domain of unknown function (DUF4136)
MYPSPEFSHGSRSATLTCLVLQLGARGQLAKLHRGNLAMKKLTLLSVALGLLWTGVVSAQDVRYNFDKSTDFSKFKTYKLVPIKNAPKLDSLREMQIAQTIDAELAQKGLIKTDKDTADLYVGYQAAIDTEKQFTSYNTDWGYGPGWYGGGWYGTGGGVTTGETTTIYVGQLAIDMNDSKNHLLVWRGVVSKTIDVKAKPEKQQKNLTKAIAKLFKNYPPPTPKK